MSRARRLVTLLLLLQTGRGWTARELAERLETSERTIHRDIAALRDAGVPATGVPGPGGGFRVPGGHRNRVPLTEEEVAALLVGGPGAAGALGLEGMVLEARLKLIGSLSGDARERVGWTAEVDPRRRAAVVSRQRRASIPARDRAGRRRAAADRGRLPGRAR